MSSFLKGACYRKKWGKNSSHWSHRVIARAYFTRVPRQLVTYTMWSKNYWSQIRIIFVLLIEITQSKNHASNAMWFIHFNFEILHTTWKKQKPSDRYIVFHQKCQKKFFLWFARFFYVQTIYQFQWTLKTTLAKLIVTYRADWDELVGVIHHGNE